MEEDKKKTKKGQHLLPRTGIRSISGKFNDEEFEQLIMEECGIISRVAKRMGYKTTAPVYLRISKIEGLKQRINDEYRQNAIIMAREGLIHHLKEKDKDMIKFALQTLDTEMGFCTRQSIDVHMKHDVEMSIKDDQVDTFKQMLMKEVEKLEDAEIIDITEENE